MRKLFYLLLLLPVVVQAQSDINYVQTLIYREATTTSDASKARANIVYYDAIGRPIQQIAGKMSNDSKDIITHFAYDSYGRQPKQYLPYASGTDGLEYDEDAEGSTAAFYAPPAYEVTPNPYTESFFESSPLNRVLKQAAPGAPWQGSTVDNNDKAVKFAYKANLANEVKLLKAVAAWDQATEIFNETFSDGGYYGAAQLYKTVTTDENGVSVEEFRNQMEQVVLKRAYEGAEKHDTYYVYDQYGNLSFVLPPMAEGQLSEGLCYYYKYDRRNRLVEKKLPSKQWEYIVYDALDRVIATGPALSPFGEANSEGWIYTYYEMLERPAITGWIAANGINSEIRASLQSTNYFSVGTPLGRYLDNATFDSVDNIPVGYKTRGIVNAGLKLLTVNYYDKYNFYGGNTTPGANNGNNYGQLLMRHPVGMIVGSWARVLTEPSGTVGDLTSTFYNRSKGNVIRTRTNNYMGGIMLVDTEIDFDGTVLQTYTENKLNSSANTIKTYETFTYTPEDRLLKHLHQIGTNGAVQLLSLNSYDALGQLISKKVGGTDPTGAAALQKVDYSYNIRGWLTGINDIMELNPSTSENDLFAFKINYTDAIVDNPFNSVTQLYNGNIAETYWRSATDNIRRKYGYSYDQLNRLKGAYYQKPDNAIKLTNSYNESLAYDKNGNILTLQRTGDYDDAAQAIDIDNLVYTYDTTLKNRLAKVVDSTNSPSGFKDSADNDEDDYTYDANGNMITDRNKGITSIRYNHMNLPVEIVFEGNANKKINYLYNATGVKRSKAVTQPSKDPNIMLPVTLSTDYLNGFQYAAGILQYFLTAEGYVDQIQTNGSSNNIYNYVYQYKDHLGNIRMNYAWDPTHNIVKIKEENHYYPFGLKHNNYNVEYLEFQEEELQGQSVVTLNFPNSGPIIVEPAYKAPYNYKYLGQERQDELGLNWDTFRYRNYDYAIGRFFGIDPIAEEFYDISTYQFAHNNPVWKVELEGLEGVPFQILVNADAAARPNGIGAHLKGFSQGLINSAKGLYNAVSSPGQTAKGIGNTALAALAHASPTPGVGTLNAMRIDKALGTNATGATKAISSSVSKGVRNLVSGNGQQRGEVLGEMAGAVIGAKGLGAAAKGTSKLLSASAPSNPVPNTLARVIPADVQTSSLGAPAAADVFVTAAEDISGMNATQISKALTIPESTSGFQVITFPTPSIGISSPINRTNPGFVGGGRTAGGAREFTIPNQNIPTGSTTEIIR